MGESVEENPTANHYNSNVIITEKRLTLLILLGFIAGYSADRCVDSGPGGGDRGGEGGGDVVRSHRATVVALGRGAEAEERFGREGIWDRYE